MAYQWYPGHMTKSMRMMQENIKLIDLIIELSDARIPGSGRNPELKNLGNGKSHILLLNKADLADPSATAAWSEYYKSIGISCVFTDSRQNRAIRSLESVLLEASKEKIERNKRRGINRPIRAMVVGIPNVGKSTFINSFVGRSTAKTGNKPGVTKGKQWIRLNKNLELLDTPGVLWPKIEEDRVGENLALIGAIRDEVMDAGELAAILIGRLTERYPGCLNSRYEVDESLPVAELLESLALNRKCLKAGGEADLDKAAALLLHEFRSGVLGRMTLEAPND
ncbi:MAG: ribosome biogenesis GTPase YlqF [Lachnospiraceae bacterium]|nr:ribosome biogenesis GTPase YlqF [Lachnospiraceae bacterium]